MDNRGIKTSKRKVLEALGCSLYIIAFLVMGAVLVSRCGAIFH